MKALVSIVCIFSVCYCLNSGPFFFPNEGYTLSSYMKDQIERPCVLHDLNCIRQFFARNSLCMPVTGPAPDPYFLDWLPIHLAHANVTFIMKNAEVRGLNDGKVKEFYINKATDNLVLEVEFDAITVYSRQNIVRYHRKGKEPVELSDYSIVIYKEISLTLTIPNIKDLQLSTAHVYSYIGDDNPPFYVGSGMTNPKDTFLSAVFKAMTSNVDIGLREVFVYKGPVFMQAFLQSTICDFGKGQTLY